MPQPRLHHSHDSQPGITRRRAGRGFAYYGPSGELIRDRGEKARIRSLAVPPAWTDVWISRDPLGHIQATGRDDRGRKQYVYHKGFRAWREETKFQRMIGFGRALPRLRKRVSRDISSRKLGARQVLAAAVRVLERTLMRVGNDAYTAQNGTHGVTTLKSRLLRQQAECGGQPTRNDVSRAIEKAAKRLGNTPAVCRQSYVHPEILEGCLDGTLAKHLHRRIGRNPDEKSSGLSSEEAAVIAFLKRRDRGTNGRALRVAARRSPSRAGSAGSAPAAAM